MVRASFPLNGLTATTPVAWTIVSAPVVVDVVVGSPAERAGLAPGDEIVALNGQVPRDIIEWRFLADEAELEIQYRPGGLV